MEKEEGVALSPEVVAVAEALRLVHGCARRGGGDATSAAARVLDGVMLALMRNDRAALEKAERALLPLIESRRSEDERPVLSLLPSRKGVDRHVAVDKSIAFLRDVEIPRLALSTPFDVARSIAYSWTMLFPDVAPPGMDVKDVEQVARRIKEEIERPIAAWAPSDAERMFSAVMRSFGVATLTVDNMLRSRRVRSDR